MSSSLPLAAAGTSRPADASAARRPRQPVLSATAGGIAEPHSTPQRYDPLKEADKLRLKWKVTGAAIEKASDFGQKVRLHRQMLETAWASMAEFRQHHEQVSTQGNRKGKKDLLVSAEMLDVAIYDISHRVIESTLNGLPSGEEETAYAAIHGADVIHAHYTELLKVALEGKALADAVVGNPLGRIPSEQPWRLTNNDFGTKAVTMKLVGRIYQLRLIDAKRHELGPVVTPARESLAPCARKVWDLMNDWMHVFYEHLQGGSERERKVHHMLDQALDAFQGHVESFADAVAAEMGGFPSPVRNAALKLAEAAGEMLSTFTAFVDMKEISDLYGVARRESAAATASASFAVALPEPREQPQPQPQSAASKPNSRSGPKRASDAPVARQLVIAAPKPASAPQCKLKAEVRKALKLAPVTREQAQRFGGNPIEVAHSMKLPTSTVEEVLKGTAIAIENTVSSFVHDKLGNRKTLAALLGKVESALAAKPHDVDLKGLQAELADRLEALNQMHAWARKAQSDVVKTHGAPRRWHLEYLLDTGQIAVNRPLALPSSSDPGDGRATLFRMVLQPTALSGGQPAQPLYVHLHTRDDAPITEDQCHSLDFKNFTAVHVKTHADRNKGRGWMQVQMELARQAAGSSGGEIAVPTLHRGRVDAPLLERLRSMAA